MASRKRQQEVTALRVAHVPADRVRCRYCGERSAGGSFKGYAHRYGPTRHAFVAARPVAGDAKRGVE